MMADKPYHKCFKEGCRNEASFGFRRGGYLKDIPAGKRGILWACLEHRTEARDRKEKAENLLK